MFLSRRHFLALAILAAPAASAAADSWEKLKPGMTPEQASAVLGDHLFASRGRDFEVGIYDCKAEVVFLRGQLVAWTSPADQPAVPSPTDLLKFEQQLRPGAATPRVPVQRIEPPRRGSLLPSYRL
ncbi:MAG: hypothetical protein JNK23_02995 [Opitutaceae bacterium]|nr:hypothetical protein [Opitutaceae bacterium]